MYYIWSKSFYLLLLWNSIFNHSLCCVNICSLWYPRKPSNCVALAVFKPERQSTFSVGSVSLSRWVLIYSYSTHTLRWWEYQARIYKTISRLNKTAKNAKNGKNVTERILISCTGSRFTTPMGPHYPHANHIDGSSLPPWVNSCGSFCIVYLLISAFCELHFQIFQTLANLSRGVARWILSPRPLNPITKTCSAWAAARRKKNY